MLRKLFRRRPQIDSADPQQRIAALTELPAEAQERFEQIFLKDSALEVRLAALRRIERAEALLAGLDDADISQQAADRLAELIDDSASDAVRRHPALARRAIVAAETPAAVLDAMGTVADPAARIDALLDNPRAPVRAAAVEACWNPEELAEFERAARGRDKTTHRIARERQAAFRSASSDRAQQDAHTAAALAAARALRDDDPHYDARRDLMEREWDAHLARMAATDAALLRFGAATRDIDAVRGQFPPRRPEPKAEPPPPQVDFAPLAERAAALRAALPELIANGPAAETLAESAAAAQALAEEWNALTDSGSPGELGAAFRETLAAVDAQTRCAERAVSLADGTAALLADELPGDAQPIEAQQHAIERQMQAVQRQVERYRWPDELIRPPALAQLDQRLRDAAAAGERCAARMGALQDAVAAALAAVRESIDAGAAHDAVEQDRRLRELVRQLPPAQMRQFNAELAQIGARVRELRDWRAYAETPRRETLCRQMAELADNPVEVHEQADAVKGLRAQWNALGAPDTRRDRELKKRFDRAAERAFEPCRMFFKEQAQQRAFNLEQRQAILAAMEDYLQHNDWQNPDWRGVEKVLRQARAEWRSYHPVDRKAGRELGERFDALAERIHGLLKTEWDRNLAAKEQLVAEATAVRESRAAATDKAMDIRNLQRRWKEVGPVPRRADQRLWKLFRAECDVVFEARDEVRDRHSERQRRMLEAQTLITELERRVDFDAALDRYAIADFKRRLQSLGDLPKDITRRADEVAQLADRVVVERQSGTRR